MNNQSNISSIAQECLETNNLHIFNTILIYIVPPLGIIFNLICVIVFIKIIRQESTATRSTDKSNMFKYLLLKSIFDLLLMLSRIPYMFRFNGEGSPNTSLLYNLWYMYVNFYFIYPLQVSSTYYEIAAAIDLLLLVNRKFQSFREGFVFYIIGSITAIFSFLFYIPFILFSKMSSKDGRYTVIRSKSNYYEKYIIFHNLIRDIIPLVLLILINYFILLSLNNIRKKRQTMMNINSNPGITNHRKSEINKIKMILVIGILYMFHIPLTLNNKFSFTTCPCVQQFFVLLFYLSYLLPIFSYIFFNNSFKLHFLKIFSICRRSN
jgi:hypothetical protein